jgi:hypothetical protein
LLKDYEIYKGEVKGIRLICPVCDKSKIVEVPIKVVENSKTLLTISVPSNYICEHGFQAYVDKWFSVRGYQNSDLELKNLEIFETGSKKIDEILTYTVSLVIKKIIKNLNKSEEDGAILGSALFNQKGNVLYFSLPDEIFLNMIRQIEHQKVESEIKLRKMVFELENNQKILSEFLKVEEIILTLVILFPSVVSISDADWYLNNFKANVMVYEDPLELMKKEQSKMKKITEAQKRKVTQKAPSNFWIYSKITCDASLDDLDRIHIDELGIEIDKKNILNLEEIILTSKRRTFKGKIYFSEKFIQLMEGLALTMKDASVLLSKLNKMP